MAVDAAPWFEVANELDFMNLEAEVARWKQDNGR
jgi:hypothetical protein